MEGAKGGRKISVKDLSKGIMYEKVLSILM